MTDTHFMSNTQTTTTRDFISNVRHTSPLGFSFTPTNAEHIYVDCAWGQSDSAAVRYGKDNALECRFTGHFHKQDDGSWSTSKTEFSPSYAFLGHGDTERRRSAVLAVVTAEVNEWAAANHGAVDHAGDINRNNAARTLEKRIAEHEQALAILRAELAKVEDGGRGNQYIKVPTENL